MATIYDLAFANIVGVGPAKARELITKIPSTQELFIMSKERLNELGLSEKSVESILSKQMFPKCESEIKFAELNNIKPLFFTDQDYPQRLLQMSDFPICLFFQGSQLPQMDRMVAVVGSRNADDYGRVVTKEIIQYLHSFSVGIVSGLAFGIDTFAHEDSLDLNIPNYAVLGHGLDIISPAQNANLAKRILLCGGLITEYMSGTSGRGFTFPHRNRIIAGLCDCLIVVEANMHSGSLNSADWAKKYGKTVFAVPGKVNERLSQGCNMLIYSGQGTILHQPIDVAEGMRWIMDNKASVQQQKNDFTKEEQTKNAIKTKPSLTREEEIIYNILLEKGPTNIDDLQELSNFSTTLLQSTLLEMELNNVVESQISKTYRLI
jgi:DNA protecting protein DprA